MSPTFTCLSFCPQGNDVRIILGQFDQHMAAKVFCCVSNTGVVASVIHQVSPCLVLPCLEPGFLGTDTSAPFSLCSKGHPKGARTQPPTHSDCWQSVGSPCSARSVPQFAGTEGDARHQANWEPSRLQAGRRVWNLGGTITLHYLTLSPFSYVVHDK